MALTTYHAAAHTLHKLGFNVTAIEPGKKKPWHIWDAWQETRQTLDDLNGFPWRNAGGIGVISGIGGYHGFDFDKCGDFGPVATVLQALDLPASYPWVWRSGSGNGYGLALLCFEDLPAGILATNGRGPGVFSAPGIGFDHLELRWERCQTVLPPSTHPTGPGYVWINGEPTDPPATVTPWAIIHAFHAVTVAPTPKIAPAPKVAPASGIFTPTDDYLTAERNLERLAAWRCDDYHAWVHVGMALSELGNDGFELWDAWSRGSAKYDADEMPRKWASFKPGDGYTLASLAYWAEQDNPTPARPVATYRDAPDEPEWMRHAPEPFDAGPRDPRTASQRTPPSLPVTYTGAALWRQEGIDTPVIITGALGLGPDGREYMSIAGSATGAPTDELSPEPATISTPTANPMPDLSECPPLPASTQLDPALGGDASPWLDAYLTFSRKWAPRAFDGFHEAVGLWVLSTVAARRVKLDFGGERYPSLYLANVARSSVWTKSTAHHIGGALLDACGLSFLLAPDDSTPQALLASMATPVIVGEWDAKPPELQERAALALAFAGQKGWDFDEFGSKVSAIMREAGSMADFRGILRRFDDAPNSYT